MKNRKPHSASLRARVLAATQTGATYAELAAKYKVNPATIATWVVRAKVKKPRVLAPAWTGLYAHALALMCGRAGPRRGRAG